MEGRFTILIADRNRHVREFLQRELMAEGYSVKTARNGREVLAMANGRDPPDLIILDLEISPVSGLIILEGLEKRDPPIPVVVYTLLTEYRDHPLVKKAAAFLEKKGDNVDAFKTKVVNALKSYYPNRFLSISKGGETKEK